MAFGVFYFLEFLALLLSSFMVLLRKSEYHIYFDDHTHDVMMTGDY